MTPLERALRDRIQSEGPLTVEAYMDACNSYYYATRDPLGASGDFTTAPEISQMFGELIGAALADCWARAGKPDGAVYVELGPGRGTLAADALRVMRPAGLQPPVHLVETSPALRSVQGVPSAPRPRPADPRRSFAGRRQRIPRCAPRATVRRRS